MALVEGTGIFFYFKFNIQVISSDKFLAEPYAMTYA